MFNPELKQSNVVQRVAYVAGRGFHLALRQPKNVAYRRATNGSRPKNAMELHNAIK